MRLSNDSSSSVGAASFVRADFSDLLKQRAHDEGFDKVGIVSAGSLVDEGKLLREWLARGYHGEMAWMQRDVEKRIDPRLVFPQARSIVVVALNYFTPAKHQDNPATGKVSRYAWGDDYHDVVGRKLHSLLTWIKEQQPEAEGKVCVDIQPVMDKAWAVRRVGLVRQTHKRNHAGVWFMDLHRRTTTQSRARIRQRADGRPLWNVHLVHRRLPDASDHRTVCRRFQQVHFVRNDRTPCPELPELIEENLSGWLYGCDICQDVCPWNRFEQPKAEPRFTPRMAMLTPLCQTFSN